MNQTTTASRNNPTSYESHTMTPTMSSAGDNSSTPARSRSTSALPEWITEVINGGSLPLVDLNTGTNGWALPPGDVFSLRSANYFTNKQKCPGGDYILSPAGVDFLKSNAKLDNVLARPDNRVAHALRKAQSRGKSLNSFISAVNLQIPSKENYSLVFYFATEQPIPSDSLLHRFINGDDSFRNQRFKSISEVVKGPMIVKAALGKYGTLLLSKAVRCNYCRGSNYFEIDVDISSSRILKTLMRLVLGYITNLTMDLGIVIQAEVEDELPEKLIGGVRICKIELSSAFMVDSQPLKPTKMIGCSAGKSHHEEQV